MEISPEKWVVKIRPENRAITEEWLGEDLHSGSIYYYVRENKTFSTEKEIGIPEIHFEVFKRDVLKKELSTYEEIHLECKLVKLNISELCRESGVSRDTLQRWKNEDPDTLKKLSKIRNVIKSHKERMSYIKKESNV